jgi:hypothetical protein
MKSADLLKVSEKTQRLERHWICGKKDDLPVYRVPIDLLYFNIENGRYADRMLRLRNLNPGKIIDARVEKWKAEIEKMLAGEDKDTQRDASAFVRLKEDISAREQLRPGVVLPDGGVIDGNRRLAALRRLSKESKNPARFRFFDGVILPENTTPEDRWRIEAGLQLGINERWDYSPVNELLKVREGLKMYGEMIGEGKLPKDQTPSELVAKAIYGRSEDDILEMEGRLQLVDEYLEFINEEGSYDRIGSSSEDFLEARKIVTAAENQQRDPAFIAKLKAVLFYVIHTDLMDNYDLRDLYHALGGDPRKKGRKREANPNALAEFLADYPGSPKEIQRDLLKKQPNPEPEPKNSGKKSTAKGKTTGVKSKSKTDSGGVDRAKVAAGKERFKRKMEAASKSKSARQFAEGALADMQNLEKNLLEKGHVAALTPEDRDAVRDALKATQRSLNVCEKAIK